MSVRRIDVAVQTAAPSGQTAVYLIGSESVLVVDPAIATGEIEAAIRSRGPAHVAVTHHHPDHVGGVAALEEALDVTVWARAGRIDAFATATGVRPDRTFGPGSRLPVAGGVDVLDTPGHAPEHVAFGTGTGLVTGDLAVAEGSVVVGGPDGDMRAYLSSLRRVHAQNPQRLYPAHGPIIDDVRGTCARLIGHRLDREDRVLAAVRGGASTTAAVLDRAYDKDLTGVRELAMATVESHLEKLATEGKVAWDGHRARPT